MAGRDKNIITLAQDEHNEVLETKKASIYNTSGTNINPATIENQQTDALTDSELRASNIEVQNNHIDIVTGLPVQNLGYEGLQFNYDVKDAITKGIVPNHRTVFEFGDRDNLTTAAAGNDIWPGTAIEYPLPSSSGELMSIVSTSDEDSATGTGIRSIDIHYLDENGDAQSTIITLNGTTAVDIPTTLFRFINDIHGQTWGSTGNAVGTISMYRTGTLTRIYGLIKPGTNHSPDGAYMVPAGYQFFLTNVSATAVSGKVIKIVLRATVSYEGDLVDQFISKRGWVLQDSTIVEDLSPQFPLPPLAIVKATAYSVQAGGGASINFSGWIEPV